MDQLVNTLLSLHDTKRYATTHFERNDGTYLPCIRSDAILRVCQWAYGTLKASLSRCVCMRVCTFVCLCWCECACVCFFCCTKHEQILMSYKKVETDCTTLLPTLSALAFVSFSAAARHHGACVKSAAKFSQNCNRECSDKTGRRLFWCIELNSAVT